MDQEPDEPSGQADAPSEGVSADSPLAHLSTNPNFLQLRQVVQQNPQLLPSLLQQLAERNPGLAQSINDNQEDFYQLINAVPGGDGGMGGGQGPGPGAIQVTPEEKAAIDRLMALGFPEHVVVQAYFACDKNENLAANYLFEHGNE